MAGLRAGHSFLSPRWRAALDSRFRGNDKWDYWSFSALAVNAARAFLFVGPGRAAVRELVWRRRRRPKGPVKGFWTDGSLVPFGCDDRADACRGQTVRVSQLLKAFGHFDPV